MARDRSSRVAEVKADLERRLADGHYRTGDRFLSNRAIAERFGVSYQTADRLVRELVREGRLERRPSSGTYVPGAGTAYKAASLVFHPRARRSGSFGERLLSELTARLRRLGVPTVLAEDGLIPAGTFPVIWETPSAVEVCLRNRRHGLILNDRPASGLAALYLDSVSVDDWVGGLFAAELLRDRSPLLIVSGPHGDRRARARVEGFLSQRSAEVVYSGWFAEDGERVEIASEIQGVFCANDRLAEGVLRRCRLEGRAAPHLVGFDDAPVAAQLGINTIAIPWAELTQAAGEVIARRMTDQTSTGIHQVITPRPVLRTP